MYQSWKELFLKVMPLVGTSAIIAVIIWLLVRAMTSGIKEYYRYLGM